MKHIAPTILLVILLATTLSSCKEDPISCSSCEQEEAPAYTGGTGDNETNSDENDNEDQQGEDGWEDEG